MWTSCFLAGKGLEIFVILNVYKVHFMDSSNFYGFIRVRNVLTKSGCFLKGVMGPFDQCVGTVEYLKSLQC